MKPLSLPNRHGTPGMVSVDPVHLSGSTLSRLSFHSTGKVLCCELLPDVHFHTQLWVVRGYADRKGIFTEMSGGHCISLLRHQGWVQGHLAHGDTEPTPFEDKNSTMAAESGNTGSVCA